VDDFTATITGDVPCPPGVDVHELRGGIDNMLNGIGSGINGTGYMTFAYTTNIQDGNKVHVEVTIAGNLLQAIKNALNGWMTGMGDVFEAAYNKLKGAITWELDLTFRSDTGKLMANGTVTSDVSAVQSGLQDVLKNSLGPIADEDVRKALQYSLGMYLNVSKCASYHKYWGSYDPSARKLTVHSSTLVDYGCYMAALKDAAIAWLEMYASEGMDPGTLARKLSILRALAFSCDRLTFSLQSNFDGNYTISLYGLKVAGAWENNKISKLFELLGEAPSGCKPICVITLLGNSTHTVRIKSSPVPPTEEGPGYAKWEGYNFTMLKDMEFEVVAGAGPSDFLSPDTVGKDNPFRAAVDRMGDAGAKLDINITGIGNLTTFSYDIYTEAPPGVGGPPAGMATAGFYINLSLGTPGTVVNATFRIYYDEAKLAAAGLSESDLRVYRWDGTQWIEISNFTDPTTGTSVTVIIDTVGNYVEVRLVNYKFSIWTLMAPAPAAPAKPIWEQPWFWVLIAVIVAAVAATAVVLARRRRRPAPPPYYPPAPAARPPA